MDIFSQKLQLIYVKLFDENINQFTEALVDYNKFDKNKLDTGNESEDRKQFFLNRKTVLRRWLQKGSNCTLDFQKSFNNYQLSHFELQGSALFILDDFRKNDNLELFHEKIERYLKRQRRVYIKSDYAYIYMYDEVDKKIYYYKITQWIKDKEKQTLLTLEKDGQFYDGTFSLSDDNNIFISLNLKNSISYFLFHETHDNAASYIVGVSMGYLAKDNMVPCSQKVIFAKEELDVQTLKLDFVLNETETLSAIENRLNLNSQAIEEELNPFAKYAHKLKKYFNFFKELSEKQYSQHFYYRLAFREFHAIKKLFRKVSKEESYYTFNYPQALLELLNTVEQIQNISLQIVMQLDNDNLFIQASRESLEIKKKFLYLYSKANIQSTIIFVTQKDEPISPNNLYLLNQMKQNNIEVRLIEKHLIENTVDSLDFTFIHLNDERDFVLADPIRDSKDVYKLFIDKLTMDEYRTDYQRFLEKSKVYNAED